MLGSQVTFCLIYGAQVVSFGYHAAEGHTEVLSERLQHVLKADGTRLCHTSAPFPFPSASATIFTMSGVWGMKMVPPPLLWVL